MDRAISSARSTFLCGMTAMAVVIKFPGIGILFSDGPEQFLT